MHWGRGGNYTFKTFLFVCSLNSKDVYSGFGDQLSAILHLANRAACPENLPVSKFLNCLIYITLLYLSFPV